MWYKNCAFYVKFLQKMLQKMEILNFPPVSVELEMTTTAEGNPPFCRANVFTLVFFKKNIVLNLTPWNAWHFFGKITKKRFV